MAGYFASGGQVRLAAEGPAMRRTDAQLEQAWYSTIYLMNENTDRMVDLGNSKKSLVDRRMESG